MNYKELSIENLEKISRELAEIISENFRPEVVIFIAKGSFIIGDVVSKFFNVPLVECFAKRDGNKVKDLVSPLLKLIPKKLKFLLRKQEIKSGVHNKNSDRNVYMEKGLEYLANAKNILIVDDSVDTGNTAKSVYDFVSKISADSNIKFAALNYFDISKEKFMVDFYLYENCLISGPWSKDSKEYLRFLELYKNWKKAQR
ncbi:phosphoribosyltransferase [Bacillus sp. X1(2014)]|jgi:hypoxanthine phosphoribosyltransferase|nr:phosphoribosyltransferase [Bacillus sp. X1(2014)]